MKHTPAEKATDTRLNPMPGFFALFFLSSVYLLFFFVSSMMPWEWLTSLLRILSVLVPLGLMRLMPYLRVCPRDREIGFSPKPLLNTLYLLPVFIGMVVAFSLLTTWVGGLFGVTNDFDYGDSVWLCLFSSALLPALLEELFCRYIFLPYLSVYSRSGAVFASAIFFSLMHGNLMQMPYALAAGIFLGALAVGSGSVLPCILFHLVNNTASVLLYFYSDTALPWVLLGVLAAGLVTALVFGILRRRRLTAALKRVFACDRTTGRVVGRMFLSPMSILFALFLFLAVMLLIVG